MTSRALPIAVGLVTVAGALAGCGQQSSSASSASSDATTGGVTCTYASGGTTPAKTVDPPAGEHVQNTGTATVTLTLDGKPVVMTLDRTRTPCTTNNFVSLAKQGWYTDTTCHRLTVEGIFVLQCGDPSGTGSGGPGYSFDDELTTAKAFKSAGSGQVVYPAGTVAMANAGPGTNGSQIFIVYKDSPLAPAYSAFGTVDAGGLKQVQAIAAKGVASDGTAPKAPARISQVTVG